MAYYFLHLNGYIVLPHHDFNLYFPNGYWFWVSFMCLLSILICYLMKYLVKKFTQLLRGLFIFLLLSLGNSSYILDISPLLDMYFADVFFYSVAFLCIPLTCSFVEQKFFNFRSLIYHFFPFMDHDFVSSLSILCLALDPEDFLIFCY